MKFKHIFLKAIGISVIIFSVWILVRKTGLGPIEIALLLFLNNIYTEILNSKLKR
jgi:hypothetical protein